MTIENYTVSAKTDGNTKCKIMVEPDKRRCDVTVTVNGLIVRQATEEDPTFRAMMPGDWRDWRVWEQKASNIARAFSPFWNASSA